MMFRGPTFVFLLFAVVTLAQEPTGSDVSKTTKAPVTTQKPTMAPTTAPPTSPPTTPSAPPTTPTTPPTTPTTPPTTTPTTPITTPTPPTTPTTVPTIPTTTPTTPKPAPTTPPPTLPDWVVRGSNNSVCIIANMVMKVSVPYITKENKTMSVDFNINEIKDASATGTCGGDEETLVLTFANGTAMFHFAQNTTDKVYALSSVEVKIPINNMTFPNHTMENATVLDLMYTGQVFSVPLNNSYTCEKINTLNLNGTINNGTVFGSLYISKAHVEAFGKKTDPKYSSPMDCVSTGTPDIVPIVVGLILAGLVIVVLIAYLVGRRRAQARGYLSM